MTVLNVPALGLFAFGELATPVITIGLLLFITASMLVGRLPDQGARGTVASVSILAALAVGGLTSVVNFFLVVSILVGR